jgi:hypothetical protein
MEFNPTRDPDRTESSDDQRDREFDPLDRLFELVEAGAYGDLFVCGTCGRLKGDSLPTDDEPHVHLCGCIPVDEHRAQLRWGNKDFNQDLELCYCCGAVEISSGTKWSVFYCRSCQRRVLRLNALCGRCVIPIGRHSLQNQIPSPQSGGGQRSRRSHGLAPVRRTTFFS